MTARPKRARSRPFWKPALALLGFAAALFGLSAPALALKAIPLASDDARLEITTRDDADLYDRRGDTLQVDAAVGPDGGSGRMSVRAATPGTDPNWLVFALTNGTDRPIERWVTAERYSMIGSGAIWPNLDARRVEAVTPSIGFVPERVKNDRADVFRITLEPGQTITYVAELASDRVPRVYLWKPIDYELKIRDRQLFNGIMLGLTGLLAIFLTVIFAANHKMIFPAAALVSWCVLAHLCVDFGFFHKLFQLRPEDNAVYRAATEAAVAASLVVFLNAFLKLTLVHTLVRMLVLVWILAQLALIAVAVIDPRLAATFARVSFVLIGGAGAAAIVYLALLDQDRALALVPTWIIFLVWIFGAGVALSGQLSGDIVVSGLVAGLVLVVLLIGFTVTQFAFRARDAGFGAAPSEAQLRALAVDGAGCATWEWSGRRDEIKVSPLVEATLGLHAGALNAKVAEFVKRMHPADHERFKLMLWSIQERAGGRIRGDFRMRHADNSYRWFELEASSLPGADPRTPRCIGLLREITDVKLSRERLLQDAVNDNLTGLPNRALFVDRLSVALARAKTEPSVRPTVFFIDIDRFKNVNASVGFRLANSFLLMAARRLQSNLGPQDTVARVGTDQFGVLLLREQSAAEIAGVAERVRRSIRSPMKIENHEIVLTGSIGIAVYDKESSGPNDLMKEAEIAMYRAKRHGADRIELFRPDMRADQEERGKIEDELRRAIDKRQIKVFYQPIIYLATEELAGFETMLRWDHPKLGSVGPETLIPGDGASDLAMRLGIFALKRAEEEAAKWQTEGARADAPLFVSVNLASRQLLQPEFVAEVRQISSRAHIPKGALRLEIAESLVMENPEQSNDALDLLRDAGAGLALEGFGMSFSSLAYLQRLPFDAIKIDRSIVQAGAGGDQAGGTMIRSMVALARELGRKVVAEGVESVEDVAFLRSIGCDYAQGLLYGDPIPDKDVLPFIKAVRLNERKRQPNRFFRPAAKKRKSEKPAARSDAGPPANGAAGPRTRPQAPPSGRARDGGAGRAPPQVQQRGRAATPSAANEPPSRAAKPRAERTPPPRPPSTAPGPERLPPEISRSPNPAVPHARPPVAPSAQLRQSVSPPMPPPQFARAAPPAAPPEPPQFAGRPQAPPLGRAPQPPASPPPAAAPSQPPPQPAGPRPGVVGPPRVLPTMTRPVTSALSPSIAESLRRLAGEARGEPASNPPPPGNGRARTNGGSSEGT